MAKRYGQLKKRTLESGKKTKYYYVRVYDTATKRQVWKSTGLPNLQSAKAWVREQQAKELRPPQEQVLAAAAAMTFEDAHERWLAVKERAVSHEYFQLLLGLGRRFWRPRFGAERLQQITTDDIQEYLWARRDGRLPGSIRRKGRRTPLAATTVNQDRKDLRSFFNYCQKQRWVIFNPIDGVQTFKGETRRTVHYISKQEELALLAACSDSHVVTVSARRNVGGRAGGAVSKKKSQFSSDATPSVTLYLAVLLALRCGFRSRTILEMQWGDVDLKRGQWNIAAKRMKTRRQYKCPMAESVVHALRAHLSAVTARNGLPAPTDTVLGLQPTTRLLRPLQKACSRAGLPKLKFHDLRRIFANRLAEERVPPDVIMTLMDQTSPEVFMRSYRQVRASEVDAALGVFDEGTVESGSHREGSARP